ncbi:MAG: type II toxin-antitoxin system VapC family toxin [Acidobacteria bacterium]|nr:type II toxin-antitoxin system VapC family toxin [Acidobacteriota bacterium]
MQPKSYEIGTGPKVLDSWAMLAWIRDEPPAARVRQILQQADSGNVRVLMIWINVGEVYYMLIRKQGQEVAEEFRSRLHTLPLELVLPEAADVLAAAELKSHRRISYADGFAAALACRERAALVTGDPELKEMTDILTVDWIR